MATASFTQDEAELVKDTAEIALANAAKSLAKMLKEEVILENLSLNLSTSDKVSSVSLGEEKYYVLQTDVVGQMKAKSFLIFSGENAEKTCKILLPSSLIGHPTMREAMLLEVDNIVAASVVTKYADILKRKINGHVPKIMMCKPEMISKIIQRELKNSVDFSLKVNFKSNKSGVQAEFICFFNEMFTATIVERTPLSETSEMVKANKSDSELASIMGKIRDVINRVLGGN